MLSSQYSLPVILNCPQHEPSQEHLNNIVNRLEKGYLSYYGVPPSREQLNAWKGFIKSLCTETPGASFLLEVPLVNGSYRIDAIYPGKNRTLIIEAKGHPKLDSTEIEEACQQVQTYSHLLKLLHDHNLSENTIPILYLYNMKQVNINAPNNCKIVSEGLLKKIILNYSDNLLNTVDRIIIRFNPSKIYNTGLPPAEVIVGQEYVTLYDPYIKNILDFIRKNDNYKVLVLIKGRSGSGKTLLSLTLLTKLLYIYKKSNKKVNINLSYINNRLLNFIKNYLKHKKLYNVIGLINWSATGRRGGSKGVCERRELADRFDIIILDEAQRIPIIEDRRIRPWEVCLDSDASIVVALVDERQALLANEVFDTDYIKNVSIEKNRNIFEFYLKGGRLPPYYYTFLNVLLSREPKWNIARRIFNENNLYSIIEIYEDYIYFYNILNKLFNNKYKRVAQVCSFTETRGDTRNPLSWSSHENIRIPPPGCRDGPDCPYRGLPQGLKVKWLMDPSREYFPYWTFDLERLKRVYLRKGDVDRAGVRGLVEDLGPASVCSSVYGAQGFEAEVVGVVWGRDLVLREKGGRCVWSLQEEPITDYVGGRYSLRKVIDRGDLDLAYRMLFNRYYVLLTRFTSKMLLFFEDTNTRDCFRSMLGLS